MAAKYIFDSTQILVSTVDELDPLISIHDNDILPRPINQKQVSACQFRIADTFDEGNDDSTTSGNITDRQLEILRNEVDICQDIYAGKKEKYKSFADIWRGWIQESLRPALENCSTIYLRADHRMEGLGFPRVTTGFSKTHHVMSWCKSDIWRDSSAEQSTYLPQILTEEELLRQGWSS